MTKRHVHKKTLKTAPNMQKNKTHRHLKQTMFELFSFLFIIYIHFIKIFSLRHNDLPYGSVNDLHRGFKAVYRYRNLTLTQHLLKTKKEKQIYAIYPGHPENEQNDRKVKSEGQIGFDCDKIVQHYFKRKCSLDFQCSETHMS